MTHIRMSALKAHEGSFSFLYPVLALADYCIG